jgi:hypothetical protein
MSLEDENHKWIYTYGAGKAEGDRTMRNLLGGKGLGLHDMCSIGVPVPPGFTITTEVCTYYYDHNKQYPKRLEGDIQAGMKHIENLVGKKFGDEADPLLVSVRSGARVSMPGMMDTILNLGLNDKTVMINPNNETTTLDYTINTIGSKTTFKGNRNKYKYYKPYLFPGLNVGTGYIISIIDFLQAYNFYKIVENTYKTTIQGRKSDA